MNHHETLCLWCEMYRSGYRITQQDGRLVYHAVDHMRIVHTKRFGLFEVAPVDPPHHVKTEAERYQCDLLKLLEHSLPKELSAWNHHPLTLDYEGRPLASMAARLGVAVYLEPCRLGVWPVILKGEVPNPTTFKLMELSQILQRNGYGYHMDSYRALERPYVEKAGTDGSNHLANNSVTGVRKGGSREPITIRDGAIAGTA